MTRYILLKERETKPDGYNVINQVTDEESLLRHILTEYMTKHGRDKTSEIFWEEYAGDIAVESRCNAELERIRQERSRMKK